MYPIWQGNGLMWSEKDRKFYNFVQFFFFGFRLLIMEKKRNIRLQTLFKTASVHPCTKYYFVRKISEFFFFFFFVDLNRFFFIYWFVCLFVFFSFLFLVSPVYCCFIICRSRGSGVMSECSIATSKQKFASVSRTKVPTGYGP